MVGVNITLLLCFQIAQDRNGHTVALRIQSALELNSILS